MLLKIEKYKVKDLNLKMYIKLFLIINNTNLYINHKLLPINNIDLIINLSSNIKSTPKSASPPAPPGRGSSQLTVFQIIGNSGYDVNI
jgi:hypothetical protein